MKYDIKKDRKDLYQPTAKDFDLVDVGPQNYLAIDGSGDPNTSTAYAEAVEALYSAGYAIKFAFKARTTHDFVVGPLEGLWSAQDNTAFINRDKGSWSWTMLIPLPAEVANDDIATGLANAAKKKPSLPIGSVRLLALREGPCLQIMHLGSYDTEAQTLERLHHEVMPAGQWRFNGRHHEIYLSDPRRVAPEKMKTVLRQPVTRD